MKVKISLVIVFATLLAATSAFGDGFNLVSWPLLVADTAIQAVMADSMGSGCQLTGGAVAATSDQVKYYDSATSAWFTAWYRAASQAWRGNLTTIEPDKGYWIVIDGAHPAVTLTMTGSVNTAARAIPIPAGPSYNYTGTLFCVDRPLAGTTGDDCGLIASGFTGGGVAATSDKVRYFENNSWYVAWYRAVSSAWRGTIGPGQVAGDPIMNPGNGYIVDVLAGHAFTGNTWDYIAPSKGATVSSKTRTPAKRVVSQKHARALSPSTNKSLAREATVEQKKTR